MACQVLIGYRRLLACSISRYRSQRNLAEVNSASHIIELQKHANVECTFQTIKHHVLRVRWSITSIPDSLQDVDQVDQVSVRKRPTMVWVEERAGTVAWRVKSLYRLQVLLALQPCLQLACCRTAPRAAIVLILRKAAGVEFNTLLMSNRSLDFDTYSVKEVSLALPSCTFTCHWQVLRSASRSRTTLMMLRYYPRRTWTFYRLENVGVFW